MTASELLNNLKQQGFILIPLPEGKLAVKPAERVTDELREQIRQRTSEVSTLLTRPQARLGQCGSGTPRVENG